jgi:hypothetical protein
MSVPDFQNSSVPSMVCTLFEGNYHFGLGALVNSLYAQGYRGIIFTGFRGPLPPWAKVRTNGDGFAEFNPTDGITLRFIPLGNGMHLTNYKPDFMEIVWQKHCPEAKSLFYFDPDITIKCRWSFFEEWVQAGVALCGDVNHCMPSNHPKRFLWRKFCHPHGLHLKRDLDLYFNGGFVGVHQQHREFITCWMRVQELMAPEIGGMQNINVGDGTFIFRKTDQDALNITAMMSESPISPMGPAGMDFQVGGGGWVMNHAIGGPKPWDKSFTKAILLRGSAPSGADKEYFKNVKYPVQLYSHGDLAFRLLHLKFISALGRLIG